MERKGKSRSFWKSEEAKLWRSGQLTPAPNPLTDHEKNEVVALAEELKGLRVHPLSYLKGTIGS